MNTMYLPNPHTKLSSLEHVTLFAQLSDSQRKTLSALFTLVEYPAGTRIFNQGELAEYLYVLVEGEVAIQYKPYDGPELTVSTIQPGGIFGWSAALGSSTYTSSAAARLAPTQVLRMRGADLQHLCSQNPEVGMLLLEALAGAIVDRFNHHSRAQMVALLENGLCGPGNPKGV